MQLAVVILIVHSILLFLLQLNGASPELVNKLIPDHVKRQMGLNFMHLAGTWAVKRYGIWYLAVICDTKGGRGAICVLIIMRSDQQQFSLPGYIKDQAAG
jgi:hypothetical protein